MARLPLKALEGVLRADGYQEIISSLFRLCDCSFSPRSCMEFVIPALPQAGPLFKQLFLARTRSSLGLCQAEEPAPPLLLPG